MISLNVRYKPENLSQLISDLPRSVRGAAVEAASTYLVGDGTHGLSHYVAYQYITRRQAYGQTFQSARQQRKVMAMISRGEILPGYPRRTGRLQRGWSVSFDGVRSRITNAENYAGHVVGDPGQSRHEELVGWRRTGLIVASNEKGMMQAADRRAQEIIRALGL